MAPTSRTMQSVTMTAFITHCWKNARPLSRRQLRLDLIALLACACLVWGVAGSARAQSAPAEISSTTLERAGDDVTLSATVDFELPLAVEQALLKGVPMIFVVEADVFRERWYWLNKTVASAERHMRLAYQPLTRRWRLNVGSGMITEGALGMALNQNFETLAEALAVVKRVSHWKIADITKLNFENRHVVEFRFRLDVSQLPRPLQIGTLGASDWNISASVRQPLRVESLQ